MKTIKFDRVVHYTFDAFNTKEERDLFFEYFKAYHYDIKDMERAISLYLYDNDYNEYNKDAWWYMPESLQNEVISELLKYLT